MIDSTLKNASILIVDDQQDNIDVLTGLLDVKGFTNYTTTSDPRQVFKLFDELKPDLLLLDLKMPSISGYEVMMQLKALIPANTYFPILVLTADITPETKQKALAGGASDFISKPFDLIEIDLRIKNLLRARYLHQQLENQKQIVEERVKERTKELEKANIELKVAKEKAEHSDKMKSELISTMSLKENQTNYPEQIGGSTKADVESKRNVKTILYIEDDLSEIELVVQILETHRPAIKLITNTFGKNAVQFAIDYSPHLILLDLNLQDLHGSEVIKLLHSEPKTAEIPIIIISAYAMSRQIEILLTDGAKDYLMKPIDIEHFLRIMDEKLNKSGS
ncbi:MAG: response regulator [Ignavibacteriales bacterium]|nr:response regulator [Ignavibacteriales bacterium]